MTRGYTTPVCGSGMCCSGIVRLHATLAEGTFLLLRGSYDIFGNDGFVTNFDFGNFLKSVFEIFWNEGVTSFLGSYVRS